MPAKRKPKRPRDITQVAVAIVMEATGQAEPQPDPDEGKDPAAIARGRKGGKARAAKMTPAARKKAAKKAIKARWSSR